MNRIYQYPASSPYFQTPVLEGLYLGIMQNISIPKLIDDVLWAVTPAYEYRPDMLAYDLYQDANLWWVFAQRNPNRLPDPLFSMTVGTNIYLPKITTLQQVLGI